MTGVEGAAGAADVAGVVDVVGVADVVGVVGVAGAAGAAGRRDVDLSRVALASQPLLSRYNKHSLIRVTTYLQLSR